MKGRQASRRIGLPMSATCPTYTKIQVKQATPKVPPFTGRTIPPRYAVSFIQPPPLCFRLFPGLAGLPPATRLLAFLAMQLSAPQAVQSPRNLQIVCAAAHGAPLARFQAPITITVRQHRTYSYAIFFVGTNERGGRTHTPHANPPQREASSTETIGPRHGSVATISRVAPAKLACEAAGAPTQSAN